MDGFLVRWAAAGAILGAVGVVSAWCAYRMARWVHAADGGGDEAEAGAELGDPADVAAQAEAAGAFARAHAPVPAAGGGLAEGAVDMDLIGARAFARGFEVVWGEPAVVPFVGPVLRPYRHPASVN